MSYLKGLIRKLDKWYNFKEILNKFCIYVFKIIKTWIMHFFQNLSFASYSKNAFTFKTIRLIMYATEFGNQCRR